MTTKIDELVIEGKTYVPKDSLVNLASNHEGKEYVLVRTQSAGVYVGYLYRKESTVAGIEVTLKKARNIWYWDGAASINQLAMEGVSKPENCKFPMEVESIDLIAIAIIPVTEKARLNIQTVAVWKK